MLLEAAIYFTLGAAAGYIGGDSGRRAKVYAKLNDWTKPKKGQT